MKRPWGLISLLGFAGCLEPGTTDLARGNRAAAGQHFDQAIEAFTAACVKAPRNAHAHVLLANALWVKGEKTRAGQEWSEALRLGDAVDAQLGLARAELDRAAITEALARLTALLAQNPANGPARALRAVALLERGTEADVAQALEDSEWSVRLLPRDPGALYTRGSAWVSARQFTNAQAAFDSLAQLNPKSALAPYGLARLASAQARRTDVLLHLREARKLDTGWNEAAVRADPAFAFLKDDPDFSREIAGP